MKKTVTIVLILILTINLYSQVPTWMWGKKATGAQADSVTSSVTDGAGNTYLVGFYYSQTIVFGGITLTNANSSGYTADGFIVKYNSASGVIWAQNITGTSNEFIYDVCINSFGEICAAGKFNSPTTSFGSLSTSSLGFGYDMFYVKYDAAGNSFFSKTFLGGNDKEINKIAPDAMGNLYVAGDFYTSLGLGGPTTMYSNGGVDMFIAKLDIYGDPIWYKNIGGINDEYCKGLAVDSLNNVVITGLFKSPTIAVDTIVLTKQSTNDLFIARFNNLGNVTWALSPNAEFPNFNYNIISNSIGQIYMTGQYSDVSATFGSIQLLNSDTTGYSTDIFIVKYDSSGTVLWAKSAIGDGFDYSYDICKDKVGGIYITGSFQSSNISFSTALYNSASNSTSDLFVSKYDTAGNLLWALSNGGTEKETAKSISINSSGNIFIAGMFRSPAITFGSSNLVNSVSTQDEIFLAKLTSTTVGIENNFSNTNISIYPNPSNGEFNFDNIENKSVIEVYDFAGNLVFHSVANDSKLLIDLSDKAAGFYFYKIKNTNGKEYSGKMVLN